MTATAPTVERPLALGLRGPAIVLPTAMVLFDPWAESRHAPATLALAAAVFGVLLQLTLVGEGWPLRHLPTRAAGAATLGLSWAVGLVLYFALVGFVPPPGSHVIARTGPVPAPELGAAVACVGVWQVLCFVVLRGRPSSAIESRAVRLACAHALVLGGGLLTYLALRALDNARLTAIAGCLVAGGLLSGMLFELSVGRPLGVAAALLTAAALFVALSAVARGLTFTRATPDDWIVHTSLNALAAATILHVAVGRRWPFAAREPVP